jgi:Cu/Ag efflux pump CusA
LVGLLSEAEGWRSRLTVHSGASSWASTHLEFIDQLRDQGKSVLEAAREASLVRLRPIAMTMISTVIAGLPLILSAGPGSESRAAIGWARSSAALVLPQPSRCS